MRILTNSFKIVLFIFLFISSVLFICQCSEGGDNKKEMNKRIDHFISYFLPELQEGGASRISMQRDPDAETCRIIISGVVNNNEEIEILKKAIIMEMYLEKLECELMWKVKIDKEP